MNEKILRHLHDIVLYRNVQSQLTNHHFVLFKKKKTLSLEVSVVCHCLVEGELLWLLRVNKFGEININE